jgi:2-oxo-4-hydroxy-4-carboxy-5-ureidoimidazoline decarboxylase
MSATLRAWNEADAESALAAIIACCGSHRWAKAMVAKRPFGNVADVSAAADRIWNTMAVPDWLQAFACHPRIGERKVAHAAAQSAAWSRQEQSSVTDTAERVLAELSADNELYEQRFGFTYIVCATGKSAEEMLAILKRRLTSDRETELREAAEQQRLITQIRLRKWLAE